MCVFCDGFRNRIRGYEEFDNKLLEDINVHVGIELDYGYFLMVRMEDRIVSAIPIEYCPMCGERLGGEHEKN